MPAKSPLEDRLTSAPLGNEHPRILAETLTGGRLTTKIQDGQFEPAVWTPGQSGGHSSMSLLNDHQQVKCLKGKWIRIMVKRSTCVK